MMKRELTGRDALLIFLCCFGVIIAVNAVMIVSAVRTFPGLDVKNSYVASQEFDARKADQERLGWVTKIAYENGAVMLFIEDEEGRAVTPSEVNLTIGRATTDRFDEAVDLRFNGEAFVADVALGEGKWLGFLDAVASDGTAFRQMHNIWVK